MNNKIPLRLLAEKVAASSGVTPEVAQDFIKALFRLVADSLYAGEEVEIDGLGKFVASIDTNNPIKFLPCDQLADELNAPFALFSPIEIKDSDSIDSILAIDSNDFPEEQPSAEETQEIPADLRSVEETPAVEEAPSSEPLEETAAEDPVTILPPPLPEEADASETGYIPDIVNEPVRDPIDCRPVAKDTVDTEVLEIEEPEAASATVESAVIDEIQPVVDTAAANEAEDSGLTVVPESEEQTYQYYVRKSSRFGIGFAMGIIVGLLIGAIALACYAIYFVNTGKSLL